MVQNCFHSAYAAGSAAVFDGGSANVTFSVAPNFAHGFLMTDPGGAADSYLRKKFDRTPSRLFTLRCIFQEDPTGGGGADIPDANDVVYIRARDKYGTMICEVGLTYGALANPRTSSVTALTDTTATHTTAAATHTYTPATGRVPVLLEMVIDPVNRVMNYATCAPWGPCGACPMTAAGHSLRAAPAWLAYSGADLYDWEVYFDRAGGAGGEIGVLLLQAAEDPILVWGDTHGIEMVDWMGRCDDNGAPAAALGAICNYPYRPIISHSFLDVQYVAKAAALAADETYGQGYTKIVFGPWGTYDILPGVGVTAAAFIAAAEPVIDAMAAAAHQLWICAIPPYGHHTLATTDRDAGAAAATYCGYALQVNQWLKNKAREHYATFVDLHHLLAFDPEGGIDQAAHQGIDNLKSVGGAAITSDGVLIDVNGAWGAMSNLLWRKIQEPDRRHADPTVSSIRGRAGKGGVSGGMGSAIRSIGRRGGSAS